MHSAKRPSLICVAAVEHLETAFASRRYPLPVADEGLDRIASRTSCSAVFLTPLREAQNTSAGRPLEY